MDSILPAGLVCSGRRIRLTSVRVQTIQERSYIAEQIEDTGYGTRLDATQRQQLMLKLARTEPNVNLALSAHKGSVPWIYFCSKFNTDS